MINTTTDATLSCCDSIHENRQKLTVFTIFWRKIEKLRIKGSYMSVLLAGKRTDHSLRRRRPHRHLDEDDVRYRPKPRAAQTPILQPDRPQCPLPDFQCHQFEILKKARTVRMVRAFSIIFPLKAREALQPIRQTLRDRRMLHRIDQGLFPR